MTLDWTDQSLVSSQKVVKALEALLTPARLLSRWSGLGAGSRQAHRRILLSFIDHGSAPGIERFHKTELADLAARDLAHVRDGKIALAYPFSASRTDFTVRLGRTTAFTVCAIDALGVSAMTGKDTEVSCVCPTCRAPVTLRILADGLTVAQAWHRDARVWAAATEIGACAADSQCKTMRLFCSPAHLETWRREQSARTGFDLSLDEGVQLGAAIFRPFPGRSEAEVAS